MASAYKCDRCGKYHTYNTNHNIYACGGRGDTYYVRRYDICEECKKEFELFMSGDSPKSLLERLRARLRKKED